MSVSQLGTTWRTPGPPQGQFRVVPDSPAQKTAGTGAALKPPIRYLSPLRYPGAKAKLTPVIAEMIVRARKARRLRGPLTLVEPFAGGAATSLRLVTDGVVDRAAISDGDPMVAAFWREAMMAPEALLAAIRREHKDFVAQGGAVAVARWDYWRNWNPGDGQLTDENQHEFAVRCVFLNRTTFSGILHGTAGPIGGRAQTSPYKISCRFNPDALEERIRWIAHLYRVGKLVEPRHDTWKESLLRSMGEGASPANTVAYLDPPYVEKSTKLYRRSFEPQVADIWGGMHEHYSLAAFLRQEVPFRWILSYDAHPELTENGMLYGAGSVSPTLAARTAGARPYKIVKGGVKLQHSAAVRQQRPLVDEMLFTTLAPRDTVGLLEPLDQ